MKKLNLDDFKKKAQCLDGNDVLLTIKGGFVSPEDCHGYPTLESKIREVIKQEQNK